ncbi:MAG: acetaldehyde dehydrogenase (acetylating) [Tissierellia bacterium]|nr:acetaldehyde dehydrogenase (acetylating) [Tissierellia bacterium]
MDRDLQSIQEARDIIHKSKGAQKILAEKSQEEIDALIEVIARAGEDHAIELAELAVQETGFGNRKDKITKNVLASRVLYDFIKDMKTIGIVHKDEKNGLVEIAVPYGVVAGLVPSTNPTSTVIYKTMICIKSGNSVVFSPHPSAQKCIGRTVEIMREAVASQGLPKDLVNVLPICTMEATDTLLKHEETSLILATGGSAMVKAAYSSGTPALGVGPGNVPVFIEHTADIKDAVKKIIVGKTFDNGLICASEQSVVVEKCIEEEVREEFKRNHCYFCTPEEKKKMEAIIDNKTGGLNNKIVGKYAVELAKMAGIEVPEDTVIIIADETEVGPGHPFSREKLSPLLGFYVEENWEEACDKCIELLNYGGLGHSLGIHSKNKDVILEFALKKPVSRMLVNTPTTLGGVGATTGLAPSFTLGCGAVGGSATSDNVTPLNLFTKRRLAYGINEIYELSPEREQVTTTNWDTERMVEKILKVVMEEIAGN